MEKLVYVLWKRGDEPNADFAKRLRGELAPRLLAQGARFLKLSAVDDDVAAGAGLRIGTASPPKAGLATFWLDQAQERAALEDSLREECGAIAGYLVVESRPLVPTRQVAPEGSRTPGFHLVTCIARHPDLDHEAFVEFWQNRFRDVAIETQSTFDYVRNEVVRALTPDAPAWDAIVEEGFPARALDDPAVFYDAPGDPQRQKANATRMFEHVQHFLDLSKVESHPMSETIYERAKR
ncbi:MAG: hypothetical protein CL910_15050 [Deltaproteobacteria bacterium]|nr:hypothetical protein [Deltaproteobacteria bacterium]